VPARICQSGAPDAIQDRLLCWAGLWRPSVKSTHNSGTATAMPAMATARIPSRPRPRTMFPRPGDRTNAHLNSPTARDTTSATTMSETDDCTNIAIFAHLDIGMVSVGLKEQALVNET